MIVISEAKSSDFNTIREIAYTTWPETYGAIISKEQLDYMLEKFYSDATLNDNLTNKNHHFLLAKENDNCLGFASYEPDYLGAKSFVYTKFTYSLKHKEKAWANY